MGSPKTSWLLGIKIKHVTSDQLSFKGEVGHKFHKDWASKSNKLIFFLIITCYDLQPMLLRGKFNPNPPCPQNFIHPYYNYKTHQTHLKKIKKIKNYKKFSLEKTLYKWIIHVTPMQKKG